MGGIMIYGYIQCVLANFQWEIPWDVPRYVPTNPVGYHAAYPVQCLMGSLDVYHGISHGIPQWTRTAHSTSDVIPWKLQ